MSCLFGIVAVFLISGIFYIIIYLSYLARGVHIIKAKTKSYINE